jgi:hypothetical protein
MSLSHITSPLHHNQPRNAPISQRDTHIRSVNMTSTHAKECSSCSTLACHCAGRPDDICASDTPPPPQPARTPWNTSHHLLMPLPRTLKCRDRCERFAHAITRGNKLQSRPHPHFLQGTVYTAGSKSGVVLTQHAKHSTPHAKHSAQQPCIRPHGLTGVAVGQMDNMHLATDSHPAPQPPLPRTRSPPPHHTAYC